ncbi:MAG: hypothetical protein AABX72_03455 [Nanoarchaeota archaeon]
MVNEYLLQRDREHARKKARESPLETTVRKGIQPSLQQFVLTSPEAREHATTCQNFGIVDIREVSPVQLTHTFSSPQEPSSQEEQPPSHVLSFEGKDYGTGKGVAMACMCGQTLVASADRTSLYTIPGSSDSQRTNSPFYGSKTGSSSPRSYA